MQIRIEPDPGLGQLLFVAGAVLSAVGVGGWFMTSEHAYLFFLLCGVGLLAASPMPWLLRCRLTLSDDGATFAPWGLYAHWSFRWTQVKAWRWLSVTDDESSSPSRFLEIELDGGRILNIPERFAPPSLEKELTERACQPQLARVV